MAARVDGDDLKRGRQLGDLVLEDSASQRPSGDENDGRAGPSLRVGHLHAVLDADAVPLQARSTHRWLAKSRRIDCTPRRALSDALFFHAKQWHRAGST